MLLSPCLEYQGCHLIPLSYLLSCLYAYVSYSLCLVFFSRKFSNTFLFSVNVVVVCVGWGGGVGGGVGSCLALVEQLGGDGGMCSLLPYGTGICYYTFV